MANTLTDALNPKKKLQPVSSVDSVDNGDDIEDTDTVQKDGGSGSTAPTTNASPNAVAANIRKSKDILADITNLSTDSKYSVPVPTSDKASLQKAINDAEQLYNKQATRNEWLDTAQVLADNIAKFGAARNAYTTGNQYNAGNIETGRGTDFNGRNDRALKQYGMQVNNAERLAQADKQTYQENLQQQDRDFNRAKYGLDTELGTAAKKEGEEFTASRDEQKDLRARDLANILENSRQRADTTREKTSAARDQNRLDVEGMRQTTRNNQEDSRADRTTLSETLKNNGAQLKNIDKSILDQQNKINAGQGLLNDITRDPDIGSKELDKTKAKYGQRAEKSGIDINAVTDYLSSDDSDVGRKKPGFIGGLVGSKGDVDLTDPKTKQGIQSASGMSTMLGALRDLQKQKTDLIQENTLL